MKLRRIRLLFCTVLAALVASSVSATPIVSVRPVTGTITEGDPLTIAVEITGAVDLFAFQFDIAFDPSVLLATGPSTEGPFLLTGGTTFFIPGLEDNTAGTIVGTSNAMFSFVGVSGGGTLAYLHFIGANVTTNQATTVTLLNLQLLDVNLSPIDDATIQNGTVTVEAVPEPATLLLVASGLAAAWRGRVRRGA